MSIRGKVITRAAGIYLISLVLISTASLLYFYFRTVYLLALFFLLSFLIAYFMPLWFKVFLRAQKYQGKYRKDLMEFAQKQGISLRELYVKKEFSGYGAALSLLDNKSALFSEKFLNDYSEGEIEAVMVHEIGHHINHDVWIHATLIPLLLFASALIEVESLKFFPYPLALLFTISVVIFILAIFISRWREELADEYARNHLENPSSFAEFLRKSIKTEEQKGKRFPVNPWYKYFFTHPWAYERIKKFETEKA